MEEKRISTRGLSRVASYLVVLVNESRQFNIGMTVANPTSEASPATHQLQPGV